MNHVAGGAPQLFSVGHSNHTQERFLALLQAHQIQVVADVRSHPYSRYAVQYNRESLAEWLQRCGLAYVYLGDQLGGRPTDESLYDDDGHVSYERLAARAAFAAGLERLLNGARRFHVAVMCAEEDPRSCHRHLLIARALRERHQPMIHIRANGEVEDAWTLLDAAQEPSRPSSQLELFPSTVMDTWRSTRPAPNRS